MIVQHEVEICRGEQPFVIQSQCATESFVSATDSQLASPSSDDHPVSQDSEVPGPSGFTGQPADDVAMPSSIDVNDTLPKNAPTNKSMMLCFPFTFGHLLLENK